MDQLGAQHISLADGLFVLLLLLFSAILFFLNPRLEFLDFCLLSLLVAVQIVLTTLRPLQLVLVVLALFLHAIVLMVSPLQPFFLLFDLLFELLNLVRHDFELSLHFRNLILGFHQLLGVEIAIRAHGLIELFLLRQLRLYICEVLSKFRNLVVTILELLHCGHVFAVRQGALQTILFTGLVQLVSLLHRILHIQFDLVHVSFQLHRFFIVALHLLRLFFGAIVTADQRTVQGLTVTQDVRNGLAIGLCLLLQHVDLADQILSLRFQDRLGQIHLMPRFIV
mmetsp:Transcript_78612/g.173508  ORF Transcript_78612/g.173508 Transcript_78612/m.173508 type:complete len:281 (+) Transcript_78612:742-1584(+)